MNIRSVLFLYLSFVFSVNTQALGLSDALILSTSSQPTWHKLIHINNGYSEVNTDTFYFSKDKKRTPQKELRATITALQRALANNENPNDHAQCRFRARYYWISQQPFWASLNAPTIDCPAYTEWSNEENITSVSMVLATGYLSNPASFFGHMLLKFNNKEENKRTDLLDLSINYGAIVPPNENPLTYIFNGLFGGYQAGFTEGSFYQHNHDYTNVDLRDVWEYRLSIDKQDTRLLLAHSWELLNNKLTYFYLTKNCGYRIAELLELVLDEPLFSKSSPWVIPVEIFRSLSETTYKNKPILIDTNRHLSRQNKYYDKLKQLSFKERSVLSSIIDNSQNYLEEAAYNTLPFESKVKIIDTLFDYYEILIQSDKKNVELQESKRVLLKEMFFLSSKTAQPNWETVVKEAPHLSQKPGMVRIGIVDSSLSGSGVSLQLRPAYFDFLTPEVGITPYSKVYMANIEIDIYQDEAKLQRLDIIDIESLSLPNSGLPSDNPWAWNINLGLDRPDLECNGCLTEKIEGGFGKSVFLNKSLVAYSYLQGRLQNDIFTYGHLALGVRSGVLVSVSPQWKMQLTHDYKNYVDASLSPKNKFRLESRFGRSTDWDIRLLYEKQQQEKLSLSVGLFF